MLSLFVLNTIYVKGIPKQVNLIKISQSVTRAQLSDTASTQSKRIILYIICIITLI